MSPGVRGAIKSKGTDLEVTGMNMSSKPWDLIRFFGSMNRERRERSPIQSKLWGFKIQKTTRRRVSYKENYVKGSSAGKRKINISKMTKFCPKIFE